MASQAPTNQLTNPLTGILPQTLFNFTTLFSYPVFFRLFHALLGVVVHFLEFLRSFRLECLLSQFSPFVARIKNLRNDPVFFFLFFLLTMFAKDLAVSATVALKVVISDFMSASSLLMKVRGANFPPLIA